MRGQRTLLRCKTAYQEIEIQRGVKQGCVLSPCLFNLCPEVIFRQVEDRHGVLVGWENINNLGYADDIVLKTEN